MAKGIKIKVKCSHCKRYVFHTGYHAQWGFLFHGLACRMCMALLNDRNFRQQLIESRKKKQARLVLNG